MAVARLVGRVRLGLSDASAASNSWARRLTALFGPAALVAVGYMDPGNWATDLAGGSAYGYRLLSVVLLASLLAIPVQVLAARLGIVSGRDLVIYDTQIFGRLPANTVLDSLTFTFSDGSSVSLVGTSQEIVNLYHSH